jgi:hypothetical protein
MPFTDEQSIGLIQNMISFYRLTGLETMALKSAVQALEERIERKRPYTEEEREEREQIPVAFWTDRDWLDELKLDKEEQHGKEMLRNV